MHDVYVVSACRTAVGDFMGSLSSLTDVELGTIVAKEAIERAGLKPEQVEELTLGLVYMGGSKGGPARQIQMAIGCKPESYSCAVNQLCGSAMRATEILSQQIILGKTGVGVVVGAESMSNAAYILNKARTIRMGDVKLCDGLTHDGLNCEISGYHMGVTAENLAEEFNITREECDELAMMSHERAAKATEEGRFKEELVPVTIKTRKGEVVVDRDEHPKATSMEKLAKLRPAFKKDGIVTAGNASGINDGAAAMVLASGEMVEKLGLKPMAKLVASCSAGVEAQRMGYGPAVAIPKVLDLAGLKKEDIGYWEINEAFAAQYIACERTLQIPRDKVNRNGSGIAIGHPVGCTGVRIQVGLIHEMIKQDVKYGCASLCVGGGPACAIIWEKC
jgi:acetyl-CoA C-acetyltransferase